jgi:hypothetical protein
VTRQVPLPQGLTFVAVAVPKSRPAALAYVSAFVEDAKASVRRALDNAGSRPARGGPATGNKRAREPKTPQRACKAATQFSSPPWKVTPAARVAFAREPLKALLRQGVGAAGNLFYPVVSGLSQCRTAAN